MASRFSTSRFSKDRFKSVSGRRTDSLEGRLRNVEREYDMVPREEEEEDYGVFGPRGFFGNIRDYYGVNRWGDFWRGLFGQTRRSASQGLYDIPGHWGADNAQVIREIMED